MRLISLFILVLFMTFSCKPADRQQAEVRYLALGDSYTIGEGVGENLRYPVQIADSLEKLGFRVDVPEIIAATGWTTGELKAGIARALPEGSYQLVSLLIGVNNQYRGMDTVIYRKEFAELLDQAIAFAGNREESVLVLSIPDWGVMPFAANRDRDKIADEIDLYNRIGKEITLNRSVAWIDVTGISRRAANDPSLVASDGLHPSGRMYGLWVNAAMPSILEIVQGE